MASPPPSDPQSTLSPNLTQAHPLPCFKPPCLSKSPLSFAAVAKQAHFLPRFPPISLSSKIHGMKDGKPSVTFSAAELSAGAKRFSFSLIAKFTVGRPSIKEIQAVLQLNWRIVGRATLSEIWDGRHLLIILDSEKDIATALACPLRKVGHSLFCLFRWHQEYNPKKESPTTTAWVRLPYLPLPLFDAAFIGNIISIFASFLDVDDRTKACLSVKFARACIEIDVSKPIPDAVWVNLPNEQGFWQKIEIESSLRYCTKCKIHGHDYLQCRKLLKQTEAQRIKKSEQSLNSAPTVAPSALKANSPAPLVVRRDPKPLVAPVSAIPVNSSREETDKTAPSQNEAKISQIGKFSAPSLEVLSKEKRKSYRRIAESNLS